MIGNLNECGICVKKDRREQLDLLDLKTFILDDNTVANVERMFGKNEDDAS